MKVELSGIAKYWEFEYEDNDGNVIEGTIYQSWNENTQSEDVEIITLTINGRAINPINMKKELEEKILEEFYREIS